MSLHRQDSIWDNPDKFVPERWFGEQPSAEKLCTGWANTLAFSDGPRNCIGMRLGEFLTPVTSKAADRAVAPQLSSNTK